MENTVSTTLDDISQKLTTLTEEIQNLPKEDAEEISRKVSTGKTCSYRRAILWTSLVLQAIWILVVDRLAPYISHLMCSFLALFTYIGVFLAGEIIIYRILGKKDLNQANAEAVQEKYHMTLDEMDVYLQKLGNIRILATVVALVTFAAVHLHSLYGLTVWLAYALTTFASIAYIRIRGKIKTPQRFFLFDLPLRPLNEPLKHQHDDRMSTSLLTASETDLNGYYWKYKYPN